MSERSTKIKQLLPHISIDTSANLALEQFQNENLRQILKFQNELILAIFNQFLIEYKIDFQNMDEITKTNTINNLLKENSHVKPFYLGIIAGFFSLEEFEFYAEHKKEINKRIIALLIERINSQIEML